MRQAFAGLIWSQQFYHFNLERWLDGDPARAAPTARRTQQGLEASEQSPDVLVMPDKWEYPWFAAWDLAFHCIGLAHVDPSAAKHQLLLLFREWYMHPNGRLPAYEWDFSAVDPRVRVGGADGLRNRSARYQFNFLARAFHKPLINFTWWVNCNDAAGDSKNIFKGVLGLDNTRTFRSIDRPARRRDPRAIRCDGLDGEILPQHAGNGAPARQSQFGASRT